MELMGVLLPVVLVLSVLLIPMLVRYLGRMRRAEGIVISSEARQVRDDNGSAAYIPVISYRYRFNGMEYTGSTEMGMYDGRSAPGLDPWRIPVPYETAQAVVSRFAPGSRCTVYPDLSDHSRSSLRMTSATSAGSRQALMVAIAAALAILAGALVMILNTTPAKPR